MPGTFDRAVAKLRAASTKLPEVEQNTSYGTPSLTVRGKMIARVRDAGTLVIRCPLEEKEMLIETAPEIYYETDHYKGWPAVLARVAKIKNDELAVRLERAWRMQAPKKLVKAFDQPEAPAKKTPAKKSSPKPKAKVRKKI